MYRLFAQNYWKEKNIPFHLEFRDNQAPFPVHSHDFHELVFIYSGNAMHLTKYGNYEIREGDILSIKPGQSHGFKKMNNLVLMNIFIKPAFLAQDAFHLGNTAGYGALFEQDAKTAEKAPPLHFHLSKAQSFEARSLIESMRRETDGASAGYVTQATAFFLQLLVLCVRAYENIGQAGDNASFRLVDYIEKNFLKTIRARDLMLVSGLSASSMLRTCKRVTGCSPAEYQKKLRMLSAIDDLVQSDKSVTQIALDAGYNDSNYFSRLFKKFANLTPSEYRAQNKFAEKTVF